MTQLTYQSIRQSVMMDFGKLWGSVAAHSYGRPFMLLAVPRHVCTGLKWRKIKACPVINMAIEIVRFLSKWRLSSLEITWLQWIAYIQPIYACKNRQGKSQSQIAAIPWPQEDEKKDKYSLGQSKQIHKKYENQVPLPPAEWSDSYKIFIGTFCKFDQWLESLFTT